MPTAIWTGILLAAVGGSILTEIFSERSGATAAISGFFLVFCGTLLMARLSHSPDALRRLKESLRALRRARDAAGADAQPLKAATFFRYGNIRPAEEAARAIGLLVLRRGTQPAHRRPAAPTARVSVAAPDRRGARTPRRPRGAAARNGRLRPDARHAGHAARAVADVLRSRLERRRGYGDLDGLRDDDDGLRARPRKLIFEPLASKVEQRDRRDPAQSIVDLEAVMLLYDRQHPEYIRDVIGNAMHSHAMRPHEFARAAGRAERVPRHVDAADDSHATNALLDLGWNRRTAKTTRSSRTPISRA